jgi:hypothetical protein
LKRGSVVILGAPPIEVERRGCLTSGWVTSSDEEVVGGEADRFIVVVMEGYCERRGWLCEMRG